jgi:hypothetical protein
MIPILLGTEQQSGKPLYLSRNLFRTHFHLLGATGTGKTNAIRVILRAIMADPRPKSCLFLVDPMGNLSRDLLSWIANERLCPQHVRERLIYIEPARSQIVVPFNPLLHDSEDQLYFQVGRSVEVVLRAWASQNVEEMPRLRNWTFASFFAVAAMGLPLVACQYLLRPGTDEHVAILRRLPKELQQMWGEILHSKHEAVRILESTRNRLAPFFDCGILRRMFSCVESRFDVARFIRERRIVILNVGSYGKLDRHIAQTIGGLAVNEIIRTAMNMSPAEVDPTYVLLDEFERFVSIDLYDALPTVRQMGLRLILAHQSLAQLLRGDIDMTGLIWQARSRLIFANDGDDADRMADELAKLTFDPMQLKEVLYSHRQRIAGHRKEWLESTSRTTSVSRGEDTQQGASTSRGVHESPGALPSKSRNNSDSHGSSSKYGESTSESSGGHVSLVPVHEDFLEITHKDYYDFNAQRTIWAQKIRKRKTGEAYAKLRDDDQLYDVRVEYQPTGETAKVRDKIEALIERNFQADLFRSMASVEKEAEQIRESLLRDPPITINLPPRREELPAQPPPSPEPPKADVSPFL